MFSSNDNNYDSGVSLRQSIHHASCLDATALDEGFISIFLLLSPLPLQQDPDEMLKIEVRPKGIYKEHLSILMALPQHEVAQTFDTTSPDEDIQWRVVCGVHVFVERFDRNAFGVGQS